jgi:hypothetical protein
VEDQTTNVIEDQKINKVNVFPNPASSSIFFDVSSSEAALIIIIDSRGKILENRFINSQLEEIEVSSYASGLYSYRILNKNNKTIQSSQINIVK